MDSTSPVPGPSGQSTNTDRTRIHTRLHYEYYVHHIVIPLAHLIFNTIPAGYVRNEEVRLELLRIFLTALKKVFKLFAVTTEEYRIQGNNVEGDSNQQIDSDAREILSSLGDAVSEESRFRIHIAGRLPDNGRQTTKDVKEMFQRVVMRLVVQAGYEPGSTTFNAYEAAVATAVVVPQNNLEKLLNHITKMNSYLTFYPTDKKEWFMAQDRSVSPKTDRKVLHPKIHNWLTQTSVVRGISADNLIAEKTIDLPAFIKDYIMECPTSAWSNIKTLANMVPEPTKRELAKIWSEIKETRTFKEPRNLINILYTNQIDVDRLRKAIRGMFFARTKGTKTPCLVGVPGSGKSTILNAFAKVFRTSSWESHSLGLQDADVIIIDDFDGSSVTSSKKGQLLKVFTGGLVKVKPKYKSPTKVRYAEKAILLGGNKVPQLKGDNVNALRRCLEIFRFQRPIKWICEDDPFDMVNYLFDGEHAETEGPDASTDIPGDYVIDIARVEATIAALSGINDNGPTLISPAQEVESYDQLLCDGEDSVCNDEYLSSGTPPDLSVFTCMSQSIVADSSSVKTFFKACTTTTTTSLQMAGCKTCRSSSVDSLQPCHAD